MGLVILIAFGTASALAALGISDAARNAAHDRITNSSALRNAELRSFTDRGNVGRLTAERLDQARRLPHVVGVEPAATATIGYKGDDVPGVLLYATNVRPAQPPPLLTCTRPQCFPLRDGEAVLPAQAQGTDLRPLLGRTLMIDYIKADKPGQGHSMRDAVTVTGLYDQSYQIDGPDSAYAADGLVLRWAAARAGLSEREFLTNQGYDRATVVVDDARNVDGVLQSLQRLEFAATSLEQQLTALPGTVKLLRTAGLVLFGLLAVVVLFGAATLAGALVRQRTREIGLLKAVGFRNMRVGRLILTEMMIVGFTASVIGSAVSVALSAVLGYAIRQGDEMRELVPSGIILPNPALTLLCLGITIMGMILGTLAPAIRAARMDPAVALRDW